MFGRRNQMANFSPSDLQAKEKLNLFIYEYLCHIGAVKAAQGLCADMKWETNRMALGESPGFLFNWWCVFSDLYNASAERRDEQFHSDEAKAFHQYVKMSIVEPIPSSNFNDEDSMAILKLKQSIEEEVKRLHQHSNSN